MNSLILLKKSKNLPLNFCFLTKSEGEKRFISFVKSSYHQGYIVKKKNIKPTIIIKAYE